MGDTRANAGQQEAGAQHIDDMIAVASYLAPALAVAGPIIKAWYDWASKHGRGADDNWRQSIKHYPKLPQFFRSDWHSRWGQNSSGDWYYLMHNNLSLADLCYAWYGSPGPIVDGIQSKTLRLRDLYDYQPQGLKDVLPAWQNEDTAWIPLPDDFPVRMPVLAAIEAGIIDAASAPGGITFDTPKATTTNRRGSGQDLRTQLAASRSVQIDKAEQGAIESIKKAAKAAKGGSK